MRGDHFKRFEIPKSQSSEVALQNEILRVLVGSSLTGIIGANSSQDFDYCAVFIEPIDYVVGLHRMDHYTWRSKPEGVRSEPGDIDFSSYSLRKFMSLAMTGNPSIVQMLFAPSTHRVANRSGMKLLELAPAIASKQAGPRFLGYLESQEKRLVGELKGHMPKRPELVDKYGYDTKYAAHALRLGFQGIEYMETGQIRLPMLPDPGDYLRAVRAGEYSLADVVADITVLKQNLRHAIDTSPLPPEPHKQAIEEWLIDIHLDWWNNNEL
jgi:predicted nucleotidyltransferase